MISKPIVAADQPGEIVAEARSILEEVGTLVVPQTYDEDEIRSLLANSTGLFSWGNIKLTKELLSASPMLRVIGVVGVGCDHVDLSIATERGIIVGNGPGSNSEAVAEYALMLMMVLTRNFVRAQKEIKAKVWSTADEFTGIELRGAILGLVGFGNIGRRVAVLAQCFGMSVFAYDPLVSPEIAQKSNVILTDLHTVLAKADILSIHTPLTVDSKGLIGSDEIRSMKKGSYLVNTARAPIVDEDALFEALRSDHIKAAATDVFPVEPPDLTRPIYHLDNFIATPHIAAMTDGAMRDMQVEAAKAIFAVLNGNQPRSVVNPLVLDGLRR